MKKDVNERVLLLELFFIFAILFCESNVIDLS